MYLTLHLEVRRLSQDITYFIFSAFDILFHPFYLKSYLIAVPNQFLDQWVNLY